MTRTELLTALEQASKEEHEKIEKIHYDPLYRIKLVVESTCSYLKYPYANFARVIDDEKLILKNIADGKDQFIE